MLPTNVSSQFAMDLRKAVPGYVQAGLEDPPTLISVMVLLRTSGLWISSVRVLLWKYVPELFKDADPFVLAAEGSIQAQSEVACVLQSWAVESDGAKPE